MTDYTDIRWKQRFANFQKALEQLTEFIEHGKLNKFEEQGFIKAFEYTYELAWNTLKDFLQYQGEQDIAGSRDAIRKSFAVELIADGDGWMKMLKSRNRTSHTYNEVTANEIAADIRNLFYPLFCELEKVLTFRLDNN